MWRTGGPLFAPPPSSLQTGLIEADFMVWTAIRREESLSSAPVNKEEQSGAVVHLTLHIF